MASFKNTFQIQQATEKILHQVLLEVATSVLERWRGLVKQRVYEDGWLKARPENNIYQRTYELVDSLSLKWITPLKVELDYDRSKINAQGNDGSWNSHMSFSGEDFSELIPKFVEFGQSSSVYSYKGIHAYEDIVELLNKSYNIMLKEALIKRGIKVQ